MQIFHIALASDWAAAQESGQYAVSTRGRTVEEVGFIHAARREQLPVVTRRFYADVREPMLRLQIDTDKLTSPWREEPVGDATYPHIHGPLNVGAVTDVQPWSRRGRVLSFTEVFFGEMVRRVGLAMLVMVCAAVGGLLAGGGDGWRPFGGALAGLVVGLVLLAILTRGRRRRPHSPS